MPELPSSFQQVQYGFAAHLRDPRQPPPADIEDRRLRIYRELFYNNVEDCLRSAFPVLRRLSSDAVWHARVRDFYMRHRCSAPQFHRVPEEFLRYLEDERGEHADDPPFLRDLAHYEWVELELSISPLELTPDLGGADTASCDSKWVREAPLRPAPAPTSLRSGTVSLVDPNGDPLSAPPLLSPLAWTLAYDYPVQRLGPDFQPAEPGPQPTYLIVNRDRRDQVRFLEINAVTARLTTLIEAEPAASGRELLLRIAAELQHPDAEGVITEGVRIFRQLRERDILLGTRRA